LAVGSRTVWYSGAIDLDEVHRINPSTVAPLPAVSVRAGVITDIVLDPDTLWAASSAGTLTPFDPLTGDRGSEIVLDATPDALAVGEGSVWALDTLAGEILRVDPLAGEVVARITMTGNLADIAAGDGGVWVLDKAAGTVTRIDPATNTPLPPIRVGSSPSAIAVGLGLAWITDEDGLL
jgi:streptogramin lyase